MEVLRVAVLHAPRAALVWLGRQGTRAVAALVFIGIAFPSSGTLLKPYVPAAIFLLLCLAFLRIDPAACRGHLGRPALVLAATGWTSVVLPAVFAVCSLAVGLQARAPELFLALLLQAMASPMMAAPALAALLGLDATLVLVTLLTSTALLPVTAPVFAYVFVGDALPLSPLTLGLKLLAILAGSACVGVTLRRLWGPAAIARHTDQINGWNVLLLFVFVAAVMENVAARFFAVPLLMLGLAALAVAVFCAVLGLTTLLFTWAGRERALALGLLAAQRNLGLMLAATGEAVPDLAWLYFALSQLPIYLSPHLLQPLARRLTARPRMTSRPSNGRLRR